MNPKQMMLIFLLITLSCNAPDKQLFETKKLVVPPKKEGEKKQEYLDWYSVKINGSITMLSNYQTVTSVLGKPDSVTNTGEDDSALYFGKSKYYYFRGVQFEKENDSVVFRSVDFRKNKGIYLTSNKLMLSSNTTFDDFKKMFPYTAENGELSGTDMDKCRWIRLSTSLKNTDGNAWDFLFDRNTGKLVNIDYWLDD